MLYLKYRPHTIEMLDNSAVKDTIRAFLQQKDIPHALLCVGQKGTGKTSTARIIAKAINCQKNIFAKKGSSVEPCNECATCKAIDTGSSPDVVEMDAASNRGIDQIRQITQEASFSPITGRYRVYIIDEAHMITSEGFNALLKTLEEPPRTVLFILATTNEEKIPKTIASRCIRINFGRAQKKDILSMLTKVAEGEGFALPDETAQLITSFADSSFRDATKLLEELAMMKALTVGEAQQYLGTRVKNNLLEIISHKNLSESLAWTEDYFAQGGSSKIILADLLHQLHELLLAHHHLAETDQTKVKLTEEQIIKLMKLFTESYNISRSTPIESLPLVIALVEFYNQKK